MLRLEAEKAAKRMMMSGYRHHRYEDELKSVSTLFQLEREALIQVIESPAVDGMLLAYVDVLAPTRLRAMKNTLICLIQPVCRLAIDLGAEVEFCFALSDYYINYLEGLDSEEALRALSRHVVLHYYDIAKNQERRQYSKPVAQAIRYIGRNLYGPCKVPEVAAYVGLNRTYFSRVFTLQVGLPPSKYILQRKLEAAKELLTFTDISVAEAAESLGFFDIAHFSRRFKEAFGLPPSHLRRREAVRRLG
jgi:AraC-like DNA-binding protein